MKNIFKYSFLVLFFLGFYSKSGKAQDSSRVQISLLTCTPGEELYSTFGHSAIRIIDSNNVTDYVYNFGCFNFDDDDFYFKFIRGRLLYFVNVERTDEFITAYHEANRNITEQTLSLTFNEKKEIQKALNENLKEENKFYKYDFFYDNCTTRVRDILSKYKSPLPKFPYVMPSETTFRQAIHFYLDNNQQDWSKLGIDILLGQPTDKIMTVSEQEFLPDNLLTALDSCKNTQYVANKKQVYELTSQVSINHFWTPLLYFYVFAFFIFLLSLINNKFTTILLSVFDRIFFFSLGLLGIILIIMWVATDHTMTKNNFNLAWATPFHFIAAFFINSNRRIVKRYFLFTTFFTIILLLTWRFLPQEMNDALLPIVALIVYRSTVQYLKK